jgi:hypothetical protein
MRIISSLSCLSVYPSLSVHLSVYPPYFFRLVRLINSTCLNIKENGKCHTLVTAKETAKGKTSGCSNKEIISEQL